MLYPLALASPRLQQLGILGEVFAARHQGKTAKVGDNGLHSLRIPVFLHHAPLHLRMSGLGVEKKERVTQGRNGWWRANQHPKWMDFYMEFSHWKIYSYGNLWKHIQRSDYIYGFGWSMMEIVQETMVFSCMFMLPVQCGGFFRFLDDLPFNFNEFNGMSIALSKAQPPRWCLSYSPAGRAKLKSKRRRSK